MAIHDGATHLSFALDVDAGWPPVGIERLPFQKVAQGYELLVPPLFVKGLSVGDVIEPDIDPVNGLVFSWRTITPSARTTVWLIREAPSASGLEEALRQLLALQCNVERLEDFGCYAIDVPQEVAIADVDGILNALDPDEVAAVFPSMRHPDGSDEEGEV